MAISLTHFVCPGMTPTRWKRWSDGGIISWKKPNF